MLSFIDGYKRYTLGIGLLLNNLLKFLGYADGPTAQEITDAVNMILTVLIMILTYQAKKNEVK